MGDIARNIGRVFLIAIAIALMSTFVAATQARAAGVRFNRFTPLNIRPDVAVRGNVGANVQVNVANVNGFRPVRVNGFSVNAFSPDVILVPQQQAFFVTPSFVTPVHVNGFGVRTFDVRGFGSCGGCCH